MSFAARMPIPASLHHFRLSAGIRSFAERTPAKTALIFGERSLSYRGMAERIARVANLAEGLGLGFGDVVALIAPNCLEYAEIVAGLSDVGIVVATLNPRLTGHELALIAADCKPRAVFVHPSALASLDPAWTDGCKVIVLGDAYEDLLGRARSSFALPAIAEWHSFSISYTSGTTGQPKGVMLSHRGRALAFMMMQAEYRCFGHRDHFLAISPQYHGAGFAFSYAPLALGGTCTLFGSYDPEQVLDRIAQGDIDGVFMVPTHFHRLLQLPRATLDAARGRHRLKAIISNAAALPQPTKEQIIDQLGEGLLNESYGSTEVGFVTNIGPEDQRRKPNSVGLPFIGMEVQVRDAAGGIAEAGIAGELFARGPTTFNGYLNQPEETAAAVDPDGWVTVGDMAVRDEEGFYHIVDRKKDMIVTGGVNVYPREVENVIARVDGVAEVAVVGLPDREWGERLHAFIVPSAHRPPDEAAIIDACRSELAGFKIPRGISIIEELPRNAAGKIMKRDLREAPTEVA